MTTKQNIYKYFVQFLPKYVGLVKISLRIKSLKTSVDKKNSICHFLETTQVLTGSKGLEQRMCTAQL